MTKEKLIEDMKRWGFAPVYKGTECIGFNLPDLSDTPAEQEWEKDFDAPERFTTCKSDSCCGGERNGCACGHLCVMEVYASPDDIKAFIRKVEAQARTEERNIPMGVSRWREHGEKYGYFDYFKEEIRRWLDNHLSPDHCRKEHNKGDCGDCSCHACAEGISVEAVERAREITLRVFDRVIEGKDV